MMSKPPWLFESEKYLGTKEVKGPQHNELITGWWKTIKRGGIKDDETPWCAAFVGACLENVGILSTRFESAKSYLEWGIPLDHPEYGCIVIFERNGGGHVGFVVGRDEVGHIMVLGGNQADEVNIKPFDAVSRMAEYRWPIDYPAPTPGPLPLLGGTTSKLSNNEA